MADESKKPGSKAGETTLDLLGTLAGLAGNVLLGPDSMGIDFGAPFKVGAASLKAKRQEDDLLKYLNSTPATAPLAEHLPALIDAGGLINNTDLLDHPDVKGMFGGGSGIFPGESGGLPTGNLPSTLQSMTPPTPVRSSQLDARILQDHPEILKSMLSQTPADTTKDMLQNILLGKQIAGFETPEQKREAQLADRMTVLDATDKLIGARQSEQKGEALRLQNSKITPKEEESFNTIDDLRKAQQSILIDIESGLSPSYVKDLAAKLPGGERALQATDPQFAAFRKNINESLATYQKAISGVAISEPEARRLRPTQPQAGDDIEVLRGVASNNIKKANELYFIKALNAANRGGDVSQYVDSQSLQKYKAVRDAMNYNLKEALANPRVMQIRQELGIDYGAANIGKK